MSLDQTVSELRKEITELRRMLFIAATALLVGLMLWNLYFALYIPKFEAIIEVMLGSREDLPELTKVVSTYGRAAGGWMPSAVIISFTAIAWLVMSGHKRTAKLILVAVVSAILLVLHLLMMDLAFRMPIVQFIQGPNQRA